MHLQATTGDPCFLQAASTHCENQTNTRLCACHHYRSPSVGSQAERRSSPMTRHLCHQGSLSAAAEVWRSLLHTLLSPWEPGVRGNPGVCPIPLHCREVANMGSPWDPTTGLSRGTQENVSTKEQSAMSDLHPAQNKAGRYNHGKKCKSRT